MSHQRPMQTKRQQDLQREQVLLQETLLPISGAIQVLKALLAESGQAVAQAVHSVQSM